MLRTRRSDAPDQGGDAIGRILRAEQDAERELAAAQQEGEELIAAARRRSVEIAERADQRVTRLNVLCAQRTAQMIEQLRAAEREQEALSQRPLPRAALEAAVDAVADWLLGGEEP